MTRATCRMSTRTGAGSSSSSRFCGCTMCDLVGPHYVQYRTAARIVRRQTRQMFIQMAFNLPLCLDDEAEAGAVAERPRPARRWRMSRNTRAD